MWHLWNWYNFSQGFVSPAKTHYKKKLIQQIILLWRTINKIGYKNEMTKSRLLPNQETRMANTIYLFCIIKLLLSIGTHFDLQRICLSKHWRHLVSFWNCTPPWISFLFYLGLHYQLRRSESIVSSKFYSIIN